MQVHWTISYLLLFIIVTNMLLFPFQAQQIHVNSLREERVGEGTRGIKKNKNTKTMSANERRALKTLGIIMGVFIFCWLPFFIVLPTQVLCGFCIGAFYQFSFVWLGYINSACNPILYSRSPEFMAAYKHLLSCGSRKLWLLSKFRGFSQWTSTA